MNGISITPVQNRSDLKSFIELPWKIYKDDPNWVPPLKSEQSKLLDPAKHPFWKTAERELFLARQGSEVVGRIAAIVDQAYIGHYEVKAGAFGFFECQNYPEAAVSLFIEAEKWLRAKGMESVVGPLNPSINYEMGVLIQGFDLPPVLGMTYNHPYYHELIYSCGYRKAKDLLAYRFTREFQPPDWFFSVGEKLTQKEEIRIRLANRKQFESEVRLVNQIFNECWSGNWGYVPMSEEETAYVAKEMLPFVDPDLVFFLYFKDEPVGVSLILPDYNPLLKRLDGKMGLTALVKKLLYQAEIRGLRGYILGVKEKYRQMGLPLVVFNYLLKVLLKGDKYHYMEVGWNLEDNDSINKLYDEIGAKVSRRYRVYGKTF